MAEISTNDLLSKLIHARHALKTDNPAEALTTIRELIKRIDPDRAIEMRMRAGDLDPQ